MKSFFTNLISATHGNGPSSTRLIYLLNGLGALFCAILMTLGGIFVYCHDRTADGAYWAGAAAMWTATLGFGAGAKTCQQKATKEIVLASKQQPVTAAVSGD